jgi:hypothetical protein
MEGLVSPKQLDLDNRYTRHSELFGRQNPPMADDHMALVVNQHGHHKTTLLDSIRELIDLTLRMLPRVAGIQQEARHLQSSYR